MKKLTFNHIRVCLQGVVSTIFVLSILCVGIPQAEAVFHEFVSNEFVIPHFDLNMTSDPMAGTLDNCTTVSLIAVADTALRSSQPDENYGDDDSIIIDANRANPRGGLFLWSLNDIPTEATVESASLTFNVTTGSNHTFSLYNLKRAWTENGATWKSYDGTNPWGTDGAANTTTDRGDTNLWMTDSSTFSMTGVVTIPMNTEGVNIVQNWHTGALDNNGLTIQNYDEDTSSNWEIASRENPSLDKPKLNVTYCEPSTTPTVTVTVDPGQSKVYGEEDPVFTYTPDDASVIFSGDLDRDEGENAGNYAITLGTLSADGYEINFISADFTITPLPIEITADSLTKTLNAPDPPLTYQITSGDLVGSDTFTGALERDPGETEGTYPIRQGSLAINDNNNGNNYELSFLEGALTITLSHLPPDLPQVFRGEIRYIAGDNEPQENDQVLAFVEDVVSPVGTTSIFYSEDQLVYRIDVLADNPNTSEKDGGVTGDFVTFIINDRIVAIDTWQGGTTKTLHFHPPFASTGGPYVGLIDEPVQFEGVAHDWGNDIDTITWDLDGDGQFGDPSTLTPEYTYTTTGARTVSLLVTDKQGGQGTDSTPVVIIKLEGLSQAFDGSPKPVTVIGVDAPYAYNVTYNGSSEAPINAGTYTVVVEITQGTNTIGNVTREMTITSNVITVFADDQTKMYGENDPELTFSYTGDLADGDSFTGELSRYTGEGVGSYEINLGTLSAGDNYTLEFEPANLTITSRPITVKANDLNKLVDENDPTFTFDITEGSLAFDDDFTGTLARESGEAVGFYAIEIGSLGITSIHGDDNYEMTFIPGTLAISVIQDIELVAGWNLVSFSLRPLSTEIADVLATLEDQYTIVYAWDATEQYPDNWLKYDPNAPDYSSSLETLDETQGFWIHMISPATLSIQGTYGDSTSINLWIAGGGWNLVGFPSSADVNLPEALEDQGFEPGSEYLVFTYIASDSVDPWKVYDPHAPYYGNDLNALTPGLGYWIYVDIDLIWNIIY